jgi:hypothetical protein
MPTITATSADVARAAVEAANRVSGPNTAAAEPNPSTRPTIDPAAAIARAFVRTIVRRWPRSAPRTRSIACSRRSVAARMLAP